MGCHKGVEEKYNVFEAEVTGQSGRREEAVAWERGDDDVVGQSGGGVTGVKKVEYGEELKEGTWRAVEE